MKKIYLDKKMFNSKDLTIDELRDILEEEHCMTCEDTQCEERKDKLDAWLQSLADIVVDTASILAKSEAALRRYRELRGVNRTGGHELEGNSDHDFSDESHNRTDDHSDMVDKKYENLVEKEYFEQLYRRKLVNSKGYPIKNVVSWRSSLCAIMLVQELYELDYRRVINGDRLMEILNTLYEAEDYEGFTDVIYIMREIFFFDIEELEDFSWLRGPVLPLYISNFMETLKSEVISNDTDSEYAEYDEDDEE